MQFREDDGRDASDRRVYKPSSLREIALAWASLFVFVFCVLVHAVVVLGRAIVRQAPETSRPKPMRPPRAHSDLAPMVPAPYPAALRRDDHKDR